MKNYHCNDAVCILFVMWWLAREDFSGLTFSSLSNLMSESHLPLHKIIKFFSGIVKFLH